MHPDDVGIFWEDLAQLEVQRHRTLLYSSCFTEAGKSTCAKTQTCISPPRSRAVCSIAVT